MVWLCGHSTTYYQAGGTGANFFEGVGHFFDNPGMSSASGVGFVNRAPTLHIPKTRSKL
jgi:hypothetical protein